MKIIRAKDYNDMSRKAANIISAQVIMKPNCVLGLATGGTPVGTYKQLVEWYNKGDLDFAEVPVLPPPLRPAIPGAQVPQQIAAEKQHKAQQTQQDLHPARPAGGDQRQRQQHAVRRAQPLCPDGQHEEQQKLLLGKAHRKGQEQRGVQIAVAAAARDQRGQDAARRAQQQVQRIAEIAPVLLQRGADEPQEIRPQ